MGGFADFQSQIYRAGLDGERPALPLGADELELAASRVMAPEVYGYVAGSAGSEATARANRRAFDAWALVPRHLRGITTRDLSLDLWDSHLAGPVLLAPIGALGAVREGAELEAARAVRALGLPLVLSTLSSTTLEEVAQELGHTGAEVAAADAAPAWFQLYWPTDREIAESLVRRAQAAGYQALVVTVDTFTLAWRPRDLGNAYLPFHHAEGLANYFSDPVFRSRLAEPPEADPAAAVGYWGDIFSHPALSWKDLAWLRQLTTLPILLKGICHPDDARQAGALGVDGLIVSNHGGRQVDGARAALDCLPEVVAAAGGLPVLFDSGVRCGPDVLKALALGARAALLGRPFVYGLALAGQRGVEHVLRCLLAELELTLVLCGRRSLAELDRSLLVPAHPPA
ncbi:MAG: alpha-hydroxy-acid oxidizing protein [Candidatus Dormibacteria bacterium]